MEKNKFTHGSLFSGIGGPEIAAEEMGWKNMFHCEINPFGRKILDYWFPNSKSYAFAALIDKVSGKGTWESNPYVWAYEFELMK